MKVEGTRSFAASRQTVWDVLNSPEQMAKLMPGVVAVLKRDVTGTSNGRSIGDECLNSS
jgi:carbon monoxide dehydrogenase subunit G